MSKTLCARCVQGFPLSEGHSCAIARGKRPKAVVIRCSTFAPKAGCAVDADAVARVAHEMLYDHDGDLGSEADRLLTEWADALYDAIGGLR